MNRLVQSFDFEVSEKKLIPASEKVRIKYELFMKSLEEGELFTITFEVTDRSKSYAQLSKVHKMIRELALYTGYSFDDMKSIVKFKAGLNNTEGLMSFANCSKEELSLAIQAAIEIGNSVDFNLR